MLSLLRSPWSPLCQRKSVCQLQGEAPRLGCPTAPAGGGGRGCRWLKRRVNMRKSSDVLFSPVMLYRL